MDTVLNYNEAFYDLLNSLKTVYDEREAAAIAHEAMEYLTGLGKLDRVIKKDEKLLPEQQLRYNTIKAELSTGKPIQYVTGIAWFMNRPFKVNEQVLIPRPETEELVTWIAKDHFSGQSPLNILDIGTGSGCIPISLKLALPRAQVSSCDISDGALAVADENAGNLNAEVDFLKLDFLNEQEREALYTYDIIVSNPPYIPASEVQNIHSNVKDFEPHIALFVPENDPMLFYRHIAVFGKHHLSENGAIYCELHADHAHETRELFLQLGYPTVELKHDMHGNPRMLKAC